MAAVCGQAPTLCRVQRFSSRFRSKWPHMGLHSSKRLARLTDSELCSATLYAHVSSRIPQWRHDCSKLQSLRSMSGDKLWSVWRALTQLMVATQLAVAELHIVLRHRSCDPELLHFGK